MIRWLATLVLALGGAGCDRVFDLSRPEVDASVIDAMADAPLDEDGDGVVFGVDNCPTIANPDQRNSDSDPRGDACDACPLLTEVAEHDEDGDGIGDRCDNCPHVSSLDQRNADGDDLGDLCDGSTATDCIAMFEPFVTMPVTERLSGTWDVEADELRQRDITREHAILVFATPSVTRPTILIGGRVVGAAPANRVQTQIGVWGAIRDGGAAVGLPAGVVAELVSVSSPDSTQLYVSTVDPDGSSATLANQPVSPPVLLTTGSQVRVRLDLATTTYASRGDVGPSVVAFGGPLTPVQPPGLIGLRTVFMDAAFQYVLVTDQPVVASCPPR